MTEHLDESFADFLKDKPLLSMDDVANLLGCDKKVIYNWTRRADPKKRPPRLTIGKMIRFPRAPFIAWLMREQSAK